MILPTKRLTESRSLLVIGGEVLSLLKGPKTVSRLWAELKQSGVRQDTPLTFDWFVYALDFLYIVRAIEINHGIIKKVKR